MGDDFGTCDYIRDSENECQGIPGTTAFELLSHTELNRATGKLEKAKAIPTGFLYTTGEMEVTGTPKEQYTAQSQVEDSGMYPPAFGWDYGRGSMKKITVLRLVPQVIQVILNATDNYE